MRAHELVSPGDLVLVAVSGGPDSVCLLYALHQLRRLFRIRLAVFHFDHRLRDDSGSDVAYVRRLAERLDVPTHVRTAEGSPAKGESVEAWATARRARAGGQGRGGGGADRKGERDTPGGQGGAGLVELRPGAGGGGLSG